MHKQLTGRHVWIMLTLIILCAAMLYSSGLFHGLTDREVFHPDTSKQVLALEQFLHYRYVWYTGSYFYDGYPLFLNHVDEFIIRPLYDAYRWLVRHLFPAADMPDVPARSALYYLARLLRVAYGLITVFLVFPLTRWLTRSRWAGLYAALLTAVAPLVMTVTHAASGDIGLNLFVTLALLALAASAVWERRAVWLFAAGGAAVGFAFAVKYQGLLAALPFAVYLLARDFGGRARWRPFLRDGAAALFGCVAAMAVAVPPFFINFDRTLHDILGNFLFIRNYGVDESFRALPWIEQVRRTLVPNVTRVIQSLGWSLTLMGLIALALVALKTWKYGRATDNRTRVTGAIFLFPFLAGAISLLGKPAIQPFHFSYLAPVLACAAAYGLSRLIVFGGRARGLGILLNVLVVIELIQGAQYERFFWMREDTLIAAKRLERQWTREALEPGYEHGVVKHLKLEYDKMSVFRNGPRDVSVSYGNFWRNIVRAPVPLMPLPGRRSWMFMNGAVLPRSDRIVAVPPGGFRRIHLVYYDRLPDRIWIGLRSGLRPVKVFAGLGGRRHKAELKPSDSTLVAFSTQRIHRRVIRRKGRDPVYLIPLSINARLGEVWAHAMDDADALNHFRLFSGVLEGADNLPRLPEDRDALCRALEHARYYGESMNPRVLYENEPQFLLREAPLAAGRYRLSGRLESLSKTARVRVTLEEPMGSPWREEVVTFSGRTDIEALFDKTLRPHVSHLKIECEDGRARLAEWRLVPDAEAIVDDLSRWKTSGDRPVWSRVFRPADAPEPKAAEMNVRFGAAVRFGAFGLPSSAVAGSRLPVTARAEWLNYGFRHFDEHYVFLHFIDEEGRQRGAAHFPLYAAVEARDGMGPISCDLPGDLPPGRYEVKFGIYNARTGNRLDPHGEGLDIDRRRIPAAQPIIITAP